MTDDTIAAISTPIGEGGIAIIRVSGPRALEIADQVFQSRAGKASSFATNTIHYGRIIDDGQPLDHVMLSVLRAPHSYTTEDTIEINCHGGLLLARRILQLCLRCGARLAEPGEFTKRAFLNGRLDLTQAEAVMDLISSKTDRAQRAALNALEGQLSRQIEPLRDRLMTVLAHIEAQIDFPDEDIEPATRTHLQQEVVDIVKSLKRIHDSVAEGKILRQGVRVAIVGRPNAGKSSLMNLLIGQERSIVTPIPGTTRDAIEDYVSIEGIPVRLIDTAGIRAARGKIENLGVKMSRKILQECDVAIHVVDGSKNSFLGEKLIKQMAPKGRTITAINKVDLMTTKQAKKFDENGLVVRISCKTGYGIDRLKKKIEEVVYVGIGREHEVHASAFANERHAEAIRRACAYLHDGIGAFKTGAPLEVVAQAFRNAALAVGEIVGKTSTEDLLSKIFSTFCIGK
jgi:tRNA modification GTPase